MALDFRPQDPPAARAALAGWLEDHSAAAAGGDPAGGWAGAVAAAAWVAEHLATDLNGVLAGAAGEAAAPRADHPGEQQALRLARLLARADALRADIDRYVDGYAASDAPGPVLTAGRWAAELAEAGESLRLILAGVRADAG